MTDSLFSEFSPNSKSEWIQQATKDLKGKDFNQVLKSKLWNTVDLDPIYTLEDLDGNPSIQIRFNPPSEIPGLPPRIWSNVVSVLPGDTNSEILHVLENGAEGLVLHLNGFEDLDELLKEVQPQYISLFVKPLGNPISILGQFLNWVERTEIDSEGLKGAFLWTPSAMIFDQNDSFSLAMEVFSEVMELAEGFPNFKSFTLQSSRYTESGSHPLEALVFAMGELIELIDHSGKNPESLIRNLLLEASVGESHFGEISRIKAFRIAMIRLASAYGLDLRPENFEILCQTSSWSKSGLDINTNLIRQTYEAMAGVLGGANFLWVKPFQEENSTELERRIARNVSSILKEEAYLDKVMDPAAGSFFLENLEKSMLDFLGENLKALENSGGWVKALEAGKIHQSIRSFRQKVQAEILDSRLVKVGVNKFPASEKLKKDYTFEVFEEKSHELKPTRASYLFELQNQSAQ